MQPKDDPVRSTSSHTIPSSHSSLEGHFPGNPIVPGVVLLEEILVALASASPETILSGFKSVKFMHPLRPDTQFTIQLEQTASDTFDFCCFISELKINAGTIIVRSNQ